MFYNPALIAQLRSRPVGPGVPGVPLTAPAPGSPGQGQPQLGGLGNALVSGGAAKPGWVQNAIQQYQLSNVQLPYFEEDRSRLGGMLGDRSPFAGAEWGGLISGLQDRAAGKGPSIAGDAYRSAAMDTTAALGSMARGSGSAAGARQALIQQGRVGQGLAKGYADARNQEMIGAQSALASALSQRDQLNQGAYLDLLAAQLGLSRDQLAALQGNQQYDAQKRAADAQKSAAKWNAIGGALGGLGSIAGNKPKK